MKEKLIAEVMQEMLPYLDNAQMKQLREVLGQTLFHYGIRLKLRQITMSACLSGII